MSEPIDQLDIEIGAVSKSAAKRINALADAMERLQKAASSGALASAKNKIQEMGSTAARARPKTGGRVTAKPVSAGQAERGTGDKPIDAGAGKQVEQTTERVSRLAGILETAKRAFSNLSYTAKMAAGSMTGFVKAIGTPILKTAAKGINILGSGIKSAGKAIISSFTQPFKSAISAVTKWKNAIGRIAFYRLVRSAIKAVTDGFKEGMDNLYQYSSLVGTEFAPAMNTLATASLYLKNSLGAMAAPLIQAVAPAVDMLIDKFVLLTNAIGKAMAALTGKTVYSQAKKYATEYADAASGASKATQKFLLGIDELTIIDDPSGGGASAMEDYKSMFEEVEVPTDEFDWAEQIREAIKSGEWYSVGELVADKLNDVLASIDTKSWGQQLGDKLNAGIAAAYAFMANFDFGQVGEKIAGFINGAFENIDFSNIGGLFVRNLTALPDVIIGFLSELDWGLVGKSLSDFLTGAFGETSKWLSGYDWRELGRSLYAKISEAARNVDWNTVGETVAYAIGQGIGAGIALLWGFIEKPWEQLKNWWYDTAYKDGEFVFDGLLQGIWQKVKDIGAWLKEHLIDPLVNGVMSMLGIASPSKVFAEIGGYLVEGLLQGLVNKWNSIVQFFDNKITAIREGFSSAWNAIKNTTETVWNNIATSVRTAIANAHVTVVTKLVEIKDSITTTFNNLKQSALTWGSDLVSNMANGIRNSISKVTSAVSAVADKIKDFIGFSEPKKGALSNAHTYMPDMLQLMAKGIKDNAHLALNAVSDLADSVASRFAEITYDMPEPKMPTHIGVSYAMAFAGGPSDIDSTRSGSQISSDMRSANEQLIGVIQAVAQQVVAAINNKDNDVNFDGEKVTKRVTTLQDRYDRMYGR